MDHLRTIGQAAETASGTIGFVQSMTGLVQSMSGLDEKMQILRRKVEILVSREADLTAEIEYAESSLGNKRKREVETWTTHLQRLKDEVQSLKSQVEERRSIVPINMVNRANQLIKEADELEMQGEFSRGATQMVEDDFGYEIPTAELVGNASRDYFNKILSCLMNDEVSVIGVYGMGGVGKTTLATNIHNHLVKECTFDVCWVTVSQECPIETLQYRIAKSQNLDLSNEDDIVQRATKLFHFLRRKKLVMILDDVWSSFNMKEVGIPVSSNGCKLILTTRSSNICRQMECQQMIKVETLSEDEAWHLFMKNLGQCIVLSLDVEQIARSVAKECAGLPLGIVVVSGSMRGIEDIYEWRNALEELKNANFNQEFMVEKVFGVLKFSYTRLSDPTLQKCFLHIALYPEDEKIIRRDLVEFFVNTGLIDRLSSRRAQLDRAHTLVNKLVNVCLLESTQILNNANEDMGYLKMHDLVRDMVINMMGSHFMIKAGLNLREVPEESEWTEGVEKVSLMNNYQIREIPTALSPMCPRLLMLSLCKTSMAKVGDSFFHFMPSLQVLDLSSTRVEILPDSISNLVNLTALLLHSCKRLRHVPSLAKLKALKTLDFSGSGLHIAPEGMDHLANLKFLDVERSKLEKIPPEILPKMSQLQCLRLNNHNSNLKVKASELISLKKLEELQCTFPNSKEFNEYVRYLQQQGPISWDLGLRYLSFYTGKGQFYSKVLKIDMHGRARVGPLLLPEDTEALHIKSVGVGVGLRTLMDLPSWESMRKLRFCEIESCDSLEDFVRWFPSSLSLSQCNPLQTLEILRLSCLNNLCNLIQVEDSGTGATIPGALSGSYIFCHLKVLRIHYCNKMKKLLAYELLPILVNVEDLDVSFCVGIEELFPVTGEAVAPPVSALPKLKRLSLSSLRELRSICSRPIACDSVRELIINRCCKLEKIPLRLRVPQNGEPSNRTSLRIGILTVEEDWWRSLEFAHPDNKATLQQYVHFGWCG